MGLGIHIGSQFMLKCPTQIAVLALAVSKYPRVLSDAIRKAFQNKSVAWGWGGFLGHGDWRRGST